jgi:hypothetical protein
MHAGYPLISQDKLVSIIYKEKSHISYKRGMHTLGASAAVAETHKAVSLSHQHSNSQMIRYF